MAPRQGHPLDIDLLDFTLGNADEADTSQITEHLGECLLCRVRVARLRRSGAAPEPLTEAGISYPEVSPAVLAVLDRDAGQPEPAANQLWLAGTTHRVILWIESVDDHVAYAHAAYLDVEAADDTSLLTYSARLGRDLAVSASVSRSVPLQNLDHYIEDLSIRSELKKVLDATYSGVPAEGVATGAPIVDGADERLEFRQLLADDLAELDPYDDNGDDDWDEHGEGDDLRDAGASAEAETVRHHLLNELVRLRSRCEIHPLDDQFVARAAVPAGFLPVATVHESAWKVFVVLGDVRTPWWEHGFEGAYDLMLAAEAETLAVAEADPPHDCVLFDLNTMHPAFERPIAAVPASPRPLFGELAPVVKALYALLETASFRTQLDAIPAKPSTIDAAALTPRLDRHMKDAIANLKGMRAQTGKNRALKGLTEQDAVDVAAGDRDTLDAFLARIDEVTGP
jgi:hypothetical protein